VVRVSERDKFLRLRCRSENQLALVEGHDFVAIAVQLNQPWSALRDGE
jgi:hypothetical protein